MSTRTCYHKYSDNENQWLRNNISYYDSYSDLTNVFNRLFDLNLSMERVREHCSKQLKIHTNANRGQFKIGEHHAFTYNVGDECVRDGYVWVKIRDIRCDGKVSYNDMRLNWMPKQRYIYEMTYGKIPDTHLVVFLDSDKNNFDPENLCCIPRSINAMMNKNRWFTTDRNNTLAAIKLCELIRELRKITNRYNSM